MDNRYRLTPSGFHPTAGTAAPLVVMDSFLVADGHVEGLDLHRARFDQSVAELLDAAVPTALYRDLGGLIPAMGRWFPRISAHADGEFEVWVRPAPPQRRTTTLWVPPTVDERKYSRYKGPDAALLASLRESAVDHGADDAVLHDGTHLIETANAALVAVAPDGALIVPPEGVERLPSISIALASKRRPLRAEPIRLDEMETRRLFTASALHGFVPVTGWVWSVV